MATCDSCNLMISMGQAPPCFNCDIMYRDFPNWYGPGPNPFIKIKANSCELIVPPHFQYDRFQKHFQSGMKIYELTLTEPPDDKHEPTNLIAAFNKFISSRMLKVVDYIGVVELHKNGHPHIHSILACDIKKLEKKKLYAMYPHRMELSPVRDINNYLIYLHKDISTPNIVAYKNAHSIPTVLQKEKGNDPLPQNLETDAGTQ